MPQRKIRFLLIASFFWCIGALYANAYCSLANHTSLPACNPLPVFTTSSLKDNVIAFLFALFPFLITDTAILLLSFTAFVGIGSVLIFLVLGFSFSFALYLLLQYMPNLVVFYLIYSLSHTLLLFCFSYIANRNFRSCMEVILYKRKPFQLTSLPLFLFFLQSILVFTSKLSLSVIL